MPAENSLFRQIRGKRSSRADAVGRSAGADLDRAIADLASRQHGVVARRQLRALGATPGRIEARLRAARLHPLHRGVYAVGHSLVGVRGRWLAAVLASGGGAALSHRSAGALWGLVAFSGAIEVTRDSGWRSPAGVVAHGNRLLGDELGELDGIPVTSPFRTVFDLAAVLSSSQLEKAVGQVEVRRLTDRMSLPELIERHPGHRGVAKLRALLEYRTPGGVTRSALEDAFVAFLDAQGLPRPRLNAVLAIRGRHFEVDCLWRERRLVAELDGRAVHDTESAFESDRERDRILLTEGWRCTRVTWRQLHAEPDALAADLRCLLAGRAVN